mgnify:CR=1 FL=1
MNDKEQLSSVSAAEVERIARNLHHDPFTILGPHQAEREGKQIWVVRAWQIGRASCRERV